MNETESISELVDGASIRQLQKLSVDGVVSAESLTAYYIYRINATRDSVNAVIAINPHALEEARKQDKARAQGQSLGLLQGIPILIKDNIDTIDMPTTAGSLYLQENHTNRDAPLVAKLRQAGAIILGKANLSEWANFRSPHSSSGWSAVGGQTRNPHDLSRSPCGSSAGSGAAVAANLVAAAIGTETSGSIICPASAMGVVGVKPTVGLVSRNNIIPISHSMDTAGPMTRTVEDAAIILTVLAGYDAHDSATEIVKAQPTFDFHSELSNSSLQGVRLGVFRPNPDQIHYDTQAHFLEALNQLEESGATLVDIFPSKFPYPNYDADTFNILLYEFKQGLNDYFRSLPEQSTPLSLNGLIDFNRQNGAEEMPHFRQEILEQALTRGDLHEAEYTAALEHAQIFSRDLIDQMLQQNDVDLFVTVSMDHVWPIDHVHGDWSAYSSSGIPAVAGYPHITVPMGRVKGLPVGLSFVGQPLSEAKILSAAHVFESQSEKAARPRYPE